MSVWMDQSGVNVLSVNKHEGLMPWRLDLLRAKCTP